MKRLTLLTTLLAATAIAAATELPSDVQSFIDDRDGCDHFRGEPWDTGNEPEVKERREFIFKNIKELCTGSDRRLSNLREKYRSDPRILDRLRDYEDTIELRKGTR